MCNRWLRYAHQVRGTPEFMLTDCLDWILGGVSAYGGATLCFEANFDFAPDCNTHTQI